MTCPTMRRASLKIKPSYSKRATQSAQGSYGIIETSFQLDYYDMSLENRAVQRAQNSFAITEISSQLDYYDMSLEIEQYKELKITLGSPKYYLNWTTMACPQEIKGLPNYNPKD